MSRNKKTAAAKMIFKWKFWREEIKKKSSGKKYFDARNIKLNSQQRKKIPEKT
jgi:hypothetical protein